MAVITDTMYLQFDERVDDNEAVPLEEEEAAPIGSKVMGFFSSLSTKLSSTSSSGKARRGAAAPPPDEDLPEIVIPTEALELPSVSPPPPSHRCRILFV